MAARRAPGPRPLRQQPGDEIGLIAYTKIFLWLHKVGVSRKEAAFAMANHHLEGLLPARFFCFSLTLDEFLCTYTIAKQSTQMKQCQQQHGQIHKTQQAVTQTMPTPATTTSM